MSSVSPTPPNDLAVCAAHPKGGYIPGMFGDVDSVEDFAFVVGVPVAAIPLIIPTDVLCRSTSFSHNAIEGNVGYCPAHRRSWYPLIKDGGGNLHGH